MADELNYQVAAEGFGSYLNGILPDDIAISAGAFSATMQQIRNILSVDFEKFAQVVYSTEVANTGLNLVNGTDVPTNVSEAQQGYDITALGSGPYGTYTASDFFGCMSGLPYSWQDILSGIQGLETATLRDIYKNLYLAVKWELPTITVTTVPDGFGNDIVTGISIAGPTGGGFGRGGASAPTITLSNGGTGSCTIGIDTSDLTTFGKITSVSLTNPGPATPGPITASAPPPDSGTGGWPGMNTVVQGYINQANNEIANIRTLNPYLSKNLNTVYDAAGTQLKIEQRARFSGVGPVAVPRDDFINIYPTALSVFVDSLPFLAQDTRPHMYAQTLEAISNINTVGGQSIIAMMRQERNAARLQEIGIELDNNIPGEYDPEIGKLIIANGTAPVGVEGIDVNGINGDDNDPTTTFTIPSNLYVPVVNNVGSSGFSGFVGVNPTNVVAPKPIGYYDPNTLQVKSTPQSSTVGQFSPLQQLLNLQNNAVNNTNLLGPSGDGTGPSIPIVQQNASNLNGTAVGAGPNNINPKPNQVPLNLQTGLVNLGPTQGLPTNQNTTLPTNQNTTLPTNQTPTVTSARVIGLTQPVTQNEPILVVSAGPQLPAGLGTPIDTGKPNVLGSLAGSKATNLIPPNLNAAFIASTLTPSTLSVQEAIDDVIRCNCDCWVD